MAKVKSPFDHINLIYSNQRIDYFDSLSDADKKSFNPYVINMGISMTMEFIPIVNEVNKYWGQLDARSVYLFYSQCIPKGKYYNKWIKGIKDIDYEDWLVDLVCRKFEVSRSEAKTYLNIFYKTDEGRAALRTLCEGFGMDAKKLKKVKL